MLPQLLTLGNKKIQVAMSSWNGQAKLDIREMYLEEASATYKPTKKGISIPLSDGMKLIAAIQKVLTNEAINDGFKAQQEAERAAEQAAEDSVTGFTD